MIYKDYKKCLNYIEEKIDLIFIDPPYEANIAVRALEIIIEKDMLTEDGLIIIETDDEKRELEQIKKIENEIKLCDLRTYGRVKLLFLSREG